MLEPMISITLQGMLSRTNLLFTVNTKKRHHEVNAYYKKCYNTVLCNCGVAARSGNSLFVANFCETTYKSQRKVNRYVINRLCDDQKLVVTESGNSYTIILPTGTKITFSHGKISNFYGINGINIIPSALDKGFTTGLCGKYNGNRKDDLTPRNLMVPADPKSFAQSWQVKGDTQEDTLFSLDGKLKDPVYHGQQYCNCRVETKFPHGKPLLNCDWTKATELCRSTTTKSSVYTASCTHKVLRNKRETLTNDQLRRENRDTELSDDDEKPPVFTMTEEQGSPGIVRQSEKILFSIDTAFLNAFIYTQRMILFMVMKATLSIIPTETWQNGWTEDTARKHCTEKFRSAPAFGPCSEHVPSVESSSYIDSCILDIRASGSDTWLRATIDNFASACKQEAIRTEIFSITNSTNSTGAEKSILSIIEETTCPGNCSGHGICSEGECHCYTSFSGDDCSTDKNKPPLLEKAAFEGECDSSKKACRKFIIPGYDFFRNSLACKFIPFSVKKGENATVTIEGESFINSGIYRSSFFMLCELPAARSKRSIDIEVVATGFHISISNNGKDFTDQLSMLIYDSLCYSCNSTTFECDELITRILMYLDDGLGGADNYDDCTTVSQRIRTDLIDFGFIIAEEKSNWNPVQVITFLGMVWNTSEGIIRITKERIDRIIKCISCIYNWLQDKRVISVKLLASVIGQLISTQGVLGTTVRLKTRYAYDCVQERTLGEAPVWVTPEAEVELKFWLSNIERLNADYLHYLVS
ncbi:unnamed protein product [Mytilus coruscus]|uniref:VWFD domain-containing protein n=1 Tax=Mytilus coruscus TaxID=42192 RepID=A0A6J8CAE8_MYTCO|nr:unnamed protein product [Mytilus coruscus]